MKILIFIYFFILIIAKFKFIKFLIKTTKILIYIFSLLFLLILDNINSKDIIIIELMEKNFYFFIIY